jgi:hypothetical protein
MSVNTNSPEATLDDDTSQGIDEPTSVNTATFSNHGENAPTIVGDHCSDDGLTIIATAASQADAAVGFLSTAKNFQSVNAATVKRTESAATDASQLHQAVHALTKTTSPTAGFLQSEPGEEKLEFSTAAVSSMAVGEPQSLS